jgi:signal transduction histidine kinase
MTSPRKPGQVKLDRSRAQRELPAQSNVGLEALRDLGIRLQGLQREDAMLETALELALDRLALASGWIFWGEVATGRLELAAARGVSEAFIAEARERGIGLCLCRDVFATGRLMFARNTVDCPRLPDMIGSAAPMTHACIPLKFERGILGVMNIANRPGQIFSPQELQFLETVGNQLCLSIDKVRTAHAESRRNAEARAMVTLARAIGGSLDQERVLAAIGEYTRELVAADRCAIFLGDGTGPMQFAYLSGPPLAGLEVGARADFEAIGSHGMLSALRTRRTLVVQDAGADSQVNADLAARWGVASAILIPLIAHERLEGLLTATRTKRSVWKAEEIALADALAAQAAVAIENARLYREAQSALVLLQEAQYEAMRAERLAAVGTLAASLAHEVRNPLNSINLQLVLLSRRAAKLSEEARTELAGPIDTARREISRLDGLVEEFLSLASIDRLSLAEGDPDDVVREVLTLMTPAARERGVEILGSLAGSLPRLLLDREKIKQVLINLVRNAIEAVQERGTVQISTQQANGGALLRVADTGPGIEPGLDVFDFFTTTKRGGTGLGLPIARRIVEAHGGSLTYESQVGRGTVFSVALKGPGGAAGRKERQEP